MLKYVNKISPIISGSDIMCGFCLELDAPRDASAQPGEVGWSGLSRLESFEPDMLASLIPVYIKKKMTDAARDL